MLQMKEAIRANSDRCVELLARYRKEMQLRKKYHNELVELRGNIRVFCRVRPPIKEDGHGASANNVVSFDAEDDGVINVLFKSRIQTFNMDKVFSPDFTQEQVCRRAVEILQCYSKCINTDISCL